MKNCPSSLSSMSRHLLIASIAATFSSRVRHTAGFVPPSSLPLPVLRSISATAGPKKSQRYRFFTDDHNSPSTKVSSSAVDADIPVENRDTFGPSTKSSQLGAWIPLGSASSLDGLTPLQVQVCGLDLVVWQHKKKDAKKGNAPTFSAFMDACPHRLAPLSQGRVDPNTGCLGERSIISLGLGYLNLSFSRRPY